MRCPQTLYRMPFRQRLSLPWSGGRRPDRRGPVDKELALESVLLNNIFFTHQKGSCGNAKSNSKNRGHFLD